MKQIIYAHPTILNILGKAQPFTSGYRLIKYCLPLQTADGILLFHTLTRELLLLTPEEYADALGSAYLREHWFAVPESLCEEELVELVRWVRKSLHKSPKAINYYTILTTTDCNARCFYCYERGCTKVSMDAETARKTVAYIKAHCGGQKVKLSWFGGEPLVNYPVIDQICQGLTLEGVDFESQMTSNAYLLDDDIITKAVDSWNLKGVQITLDGTEAVYNRSKAFIYREGSAYQVVLGNISRALDAGLAILIRLNMDLNNAADLLALADELAARFAHQKKLRVYAHLLFDTDDPEGKRYSEAEWDRLYAALHQLEEKLLGHGLSNAGKKGLRRDLPMIHCMADNGSAVVIVPDGHIGLCEHFSESELIGHIDSPTFDKDMIASWRERREKLPECGDCFYYPECVSLKKCNGNPKCNDHVRQGILEKTHQAMANEYRRWQLKTTSHSSEPFESGEC